MIIGFGASVPLYIWTGTYPSVRSNSAINTFIGKLVLILIRSVVLRMLFCAILIIGIVTFPNGITLFTYGNVVGGNHAIQNCAIHVANHFLKFLVVAGGEILRCNELVG